MKERKDQEREGRDLVAEVMPSRSRGVEGGGVVLGVVPVFVPCDLPH